MATAGDSPPRINPVSVLVDAYGPEAEARLQRDTEARLDVVSNIVDQYRTGAATWREAAARIKTIAARLPDSIVHP